MKKGKRLQLFFNHGGCFRISQIQGQFYPTYDPGNPQSAIINRFLEKGGLIVLICILLLVLALPGLVIGTLIGRGLIQIPLSSSIEVEAGPISGSVDSSSPLGIGLAVLATIGFISSVFRILKEYRNIKRLSGTHKHH